MDIIDWNFSCALDVSAMFGECENLGATIILERWKFPNSCNQCLLFDDDDEFEEDYEFEDDDY